MTADRHRRQPARRRRATNLQLLLRQLHVVEDAEQDLEEVLPPVLPVRHAVGLDDLEHDGQRARPHVQLAPDGEGDGRDVRPTAPEGEGIRELCRYV